MNDVAREPPADRMQTPEERRARQRAHAVPGFDQTLAAAYPTVSQAKPPAPPQAPEPSYSLDAETAVLGALMLDNGVWPRIEDIIDEQDFYNDANREIFAAIRQLLAGDSRINVDVLTLENALKGRRRLDYVGGISCLGALVENVPTAANAVHYARMVRDRSLRRRVGALGNEAAAAAMSPSTVDAATLIADLREKVDSLALDGAGARSIEPLDLVALAGRAIPERKFIVGRILPEGKPGGIMGHGAAAKTQLALALDICVAAHLPFFGEPTAPAIAAHVSTEEDETELHIRIATQCASLGVELTSLGDRFFPYALTATDPTLVTVDRDNRVIPTKRYSWLKAELGRRGVRVVTLDNFATLCAVDVVKPGHVTQAIALLDDLLPPGGNMVILAHVDKATAKARYSKEAYSGTAAIHNRLRWRWYLFSPTRDDDAEPGDAPVEDDGRRILEVQKNNSGPSGQRICMRIRPEGGALVVDGVQSGIVATIQRGNERKAVLQAVVEAMERSVPVPTATTNRATAYEALEAMPAYPESLRGRIGKHRLFRLLMQMRADRELEVCEFRTPGRKSREAYRIAPIDQQTESP